MKTTMKKIVLGAAAAAMAMSAIGITASAAEKHPGESGYCYYENQQAEVNCEDQPGIEDPDVLYGKHPGEAGYEYAVALLELVQGVPLELGTKAVDSFFANGYVKEDIFEEIMKYHESEKHPGECGYNYSEGEETNAQGKHPGESGYCYDANELGYDPSKYTEEQIRMIEASREVNGFVCGTLLMQFDEENAAKAKTEAKPQADENGKHPGESGYRYAENELGYDPSKYTEEQIRMIEASREVNGFVCGTLLMQFDEENAAKAKTEAKPQADENGKHPGESGYRYAENELGYDPSKYTEEQIRMIEASREVNGFVCGTLLMQFDEENAAKAKTEEKPQHATGLKVIGDVNCDGVIDVSDSVLLCRFLCEDADAVMTAQGRINADVNGDGKLTIDDNTALLDRIAKKE